MTRAAAKALHGAIERHAAALATVIVILGVALRLRGLGLANAGYDEGVYLQTLMALASGHGLYRDIFYSQPPAFILGVYPFFVAFGQDLWAARFGVVVLSLAALPAAAIVGRCVGGRIAALAALALIAFDPFLLAQSKALDAEAPQAAFSLVAVALVMEWHRRWNGRAVSSLAFLAGAAATWSTLCKLFGVATFVPLLIVVADAASHRERRSAVAVSALWAALGIIATLAAFLLPYRGAVEPMWRDVVQFHIAARPVFEETPADHIADIASALAQLPVSYAALFGAAVGIAQRAAAGPVLIGWLVVMLALLVEQTPLFDHHLVILVAPLVAIVTLGFLPNRPGPRKISLLQQGKVLLLATGLVSIVAAVDLAAVAVSTLNAQDRMRAISERNRAIADGIARAIPADGLIITDCQYLAALAGRRTPADLVDTSLVRIRSGYLTVAQLVAAAARPDVRMVLYCRGRLDQPELSGFHLWLPQHFRLLPGFSGASSPVRQIWVRPSPRAGSR